MSTHHESQDHDADQRGRHHDPDFQRTPVDWDERYSSAEQMWSGNPNSSLVALVENLEPGSVLDVGCGEGADAIWLAGRGWRVTALDVSKVAIDRGKVHAQKAGVEVQWLHSGLLEADVSSHAFTLVSAQYPALLRTTSHDAERALLAAVEPRGYLLFVHHADIDVEVARSHGCDPDDYVSPDDVASLLDSDWKIISNERRPRVVTAGAGAGHVEDIVVFAQRCH
jgi:SAM-dependent methyltransferase